MNAGLIKLATFVRDLLVYDEQLIRIGRQGFEDEDFDKNYIVVDSLGAVVRVSRGNSYDAESETQTLTNRWQAPCTLNFYGNDAYDNAQLFTLMMGSQPAIDLQRAQGVTVYRSSSMTDVRVLTGQQYGNNIELQLNIQYNHSIELNTLRIDEAQYEILTDEINNEIIPVVYTPWIDSEAWADSAPWID